MKNLANWAN